MFKMRKHVKTIRFDHSLCAATFAAVALSACGGSGNDDSSGSQSWLGKPVEQVANTTVNNAVNGGRPGSASNGARQNGSAGSGTAGNNTSSGGTASSGTSGNGPSTVTPPSGGTTDTSGTGSSGGSSSGGDTPAGGGTPDTPPAVAVNTAPIVVDNALGVTVNQPYVTVTLCPPNARSGDASCVTLDHMLLDTGSIGVRVLSSSLGASLTARLPRQTGASNDSTGSAPLAQCTLFGSGYLWGSVRRADVTIGGMTARDLPVQIAGDAALPTTPDDCIARGGADLGSIDALGAKGIVGIGARARDFPLAAQTPLAANYYFCASGASCSAASVPLERQATNPVAGFATDNNGTLIRLPALPPNGQRSVTGELVFGVGTRSNNALPATAKILAVTGQGTLTTLYGNRSVPGIVDTGTNGFVFRDTSIAVGVNDWYAPQNTLSLAATLMSTTGLQAAVPFSIANAERLLEMDYAAHDNLGALSLSSNMFIWGLPFYYGRSVYTVLSGAQAGGKTGPFIAF
ncbi:uncharacterized protein DUF3443 [Paraburkholderia rhizosphaerae]|uniref:Uncharacterized protein DUF3443 n=2 Tax=Paraburkholderia rhizosphaerae TaxID=480658 RepID=A0A4R8LMD2_9BURK|nr:uncharacterized protein DUF3443 [Paraburkholderia rhizosphaerae]